MVEIAFYIGKRKLYDRVCRWFMPSSHVEIVVDNICYSSSNRDGGVRRKKFDFKPGRWEVFQIECKNEDDIVEFFSYTNKLRYDYKSAVVNQLFKWEIDFENDKWYCSEWVITALKYSGEMPLDPNTTMKELYEYAKEHQIKKEKVINL